MKKYLIGFVLIAFIAASCGDSKKDKAGDLNDKKAELQKLKNEQAKLSEKIITLEKEIGKLDTTAAAKPKLVAISTIGSESFNHFIDLQGKIDATNISYVSPPNGQGGVVKALFVREGQSVSRGQVIARLDDILIRQQVAPLQVQLSAAEDTYRRTKNLFDQGVGTYQRVLETQTAVENLKKQIGIINQQAALMVVKAPNSGVIDELNLRVGEILSPQQNPEMPQIRIVNTGTLKITALVPENYLGRVNIGTPLDIELPGTGKKLTTKVSVAGKIIDATSRSFQIEAPVPSDPSFKPGQIAVVRIKDYSSANAITIPLNVLQNDEQGKYVIVAKKEGAKTIAQKRRVVVGELYGDRLEIKSGLQTGDVIVTEGFQELYDGQLLTTDVNAATK